MAGIQFLLTETRLTTFLPEPCNRHCSTKGLGQLRRHPAAWLTARFKSFFLWRSIRLGCHAAAAGRDQPESVVHCTVLGKPCPLQQQQAARSGSTCSSCGDHGRAPGSLRMRQDTPGRVRGRVFQAAVVRREALQHPAASLEPTTASQGCRWSCSLDTIQRSHSVPGSDRMPAATVHQPSRRASCGQDSLIDKLGGPDKVVDVHSLGCSP